MFDGPVHFALAGEVVREGGVYVGRYEVVRAGDLVGALSEAVLPDDDVLHGDAAAVDALFHPTRRAFSRCAPQASS